MTWPQWDTQLFLKINTKWTSPSADLFFSNITDLHKNNFFVLGLAIFCLFLVYRLRRLAVRFLLGLIVCLSFSDAITYHLIKKSIVRERPAISLSEARVLSPFGGKLSFPSNHAANTMAAAVFILLWFGFVTAIPFIIWAIAISYSRVYVGVHYPLDVLCGVIVGAIIATLTFRLLRNIKFFLEIKRE